MRDLFETTAAKQIYATVACPEASIVAGVRNQRDDRRTDHRPGRGDCSMRHQCARQVKQIDVPFRDAAYQMLQDVKPVG
ncbi:MAG: hypothetical protein ACRYG4_22665 [Janthinobacterium lividum]